MLDVNEIVEYDENMKCVKCKKLIRDRRFIRTYLNNMKPGWVECYDCLERQAELNRDAHRINTHLMNNLVSSLSCSE